MKRTNKKGFTIVELVIVIAVIGVLAAVLIPTFVRLIRKSKINNDTQLIRNLNTALEADKVDNTHSTMSDALEAAAKYGYDVSKINASATNNEILWDSVNDVFCYYNDGEIEYLPDSVDNEKKLSAESNKLWKIYNSEVPALASQTYSIYLGSATAANSINNGNVKVGFDVGNQTIDSITYKNSVEQSVIIRTNSASTTLTIDDSSTGTIYHYGAAGALNIVQCHTASYHENGQVAYAEIAYGRIVLESGSKVEEIHVNKKTDSSFDTVIIANNGGAEELPERITRDAVEVSSQTLVVKVESNGSSENVYVYANGTTGTTEKVTEGENKQNEAVNSALGQLVLDNGSAGEKAQTTEQKTDAKRDAINEALENTEFKGVAVSKAGEQTQLMTIEAFRDAVNAGNTYAGYTVKLLDDINLKNVEWTPLKLFAGTFDGNHKTLSNLKLNVVTDSSNEKHIGLFEKTENATIKNLTIDGFEVYGTGRIASGTLVGNASNGLTLSGITLTSTNKLTGKWSGGFIGKTTVTKIGSELRDCKYVIDNCRSSVEIEGERTGGFIGQMDGSNNTIYKSSNGFATFTSCSFNGKLNANTGTAMAGGFIAQTTNSDRTWFVYTYQNCSVNNGNIVSSGSKGDFTAVSQSAYSLFGCKINDEAVTLPTDVNFAFCSSPTVYAYSINGTIYAIKAANSGYYNIESDTIGVDAQVAGSSNHSISLSDTTDWHKVTNAYTDFYGNYIVSADASAIYRSVPANLEEGTKLQRRTYVAGHDYSANQDTYGLDMWRIVNSDVEPEGTGFGQWQDVGADGASGFVLGAGIYYYLDPTPFVDLNSYNVSSRETSDHWMIYTVTAK